MIDGDFREAIGKARCLPCGFMLMVRARKYEQVGVSRTVGANVGEAGYFMTR